MSNQKIETKPMNILFHCWEFPPRGSGIGRYIQHMSQALRDAGCYTVIFTSYGREGPTTSYLDSGVVYRQYRMEEIGQPKLAELILQKVREHNIDWIEGVDHLGESEPLIRRSKRPPVIIKCHYNDVLHVARYAQTHYFWQKFLIDIACYRERKRIDREKLSLAKADLLIAPSEHILREMKKQGVVLSVRQGMVPNPIPSLLNWINQEAERPTLLLVGRIDIGKGIEYLPGMIEKLASKFPSLSIEIAGGDSYARFIGSTKKWLEGKLGRYVKNIKFLGNLDTQALNDAYSRAWVVIIPSKWDTFPTVALEAMARGKAIVASLNGGMPEMLAGTSCVVADPHTLEFAQAVDFFLSDQQLRNSAGNMARMKALNSYSLNYVADTYLKLLNSSA